MYRFSAQISLWFYKKEYITLQQVDDITFALEIIFSNLASFLTILLFGITFKFYMETMLFFIVFIGFRTLNDRYHAPTFLRCYILTVGSYLLCLYTSILIPEEKHLILSTQILILNFLFFILFNDSINTIEEKKKNMPFKIFYILYILMCSILNIILRTHHVLYLTIVGLIIIITTLKKTP